MSSAFFAVRAPVVVDDREPRLPRLGLGGVVPQFRPDADDEVLHLLGRQPVDLAEVERDVAAIAFGAGGLLLVEPAEHDEVAGDGAVDSTARADAGDGVALVE